MLNGLGEQTGEVGIGDGYVVIGQRLTDRIGVNDTLGGLVQIRGRQMWHHGSVHDHTADRQAHPAQFGDGLGGLLHGQRLKQSHQVDGRLIRVQQLAHPLGLRMNGSALGDIGQRRRHIEEAGDPAGGRGVDHDGVVHMPSRLVDADDALLDLSGEDDIAQTRRNRGRELDGADALHRTPSQAEVVEHLEVLHKRRLDLDGERVHRSAALGGGDLEFLGRQRRYVEKLGDALPVFDLDQQHLAATRGERQGQGRGDGGLSGPALAGHKVQSRIRDSRGPGVG